MRKFAAKTRPHYIRAVIQFTRFLGAPRYGHGRGSAALPVAPG
jgi:hypothetical protein